MRAALTLVLAAFLAAPAGASAATLGVLPAKPCYRSGQSVLLGGGGFTPGRGVGVTRDGSLRAYRTADAAGRFVVAPRLFQPRGEKVQTWAATDAAIAANTASLPLRVSAFTVRLRPRTGRAHRLMRITARGFTTGKRLYVHIRRKGRTVRNKRVGRLRGACRKTSARLRLFSRRTRPGLYTVQFDTRRRFSRKTKVGLRTTVSVYRTFGRGAVASSTPVFRPLD